MNPAVGVAGDIQAVRVGDPFVDQRIDGAHEVGEIGAAPIPTH